jgi:hypothetical protein
MLDKLTVSQFAECLGGTFRVDFGAAEPLPTELVEATARASSGGRAPHQRQPFSLVFRGPMQPILPQRIYPIENERMGALEIFIVPIGPDDVGMLYQAIFN